MKILFYRNLASIRAIITLLALPTSPLTQQAISYPQHLVNTTDLATSSKSQNFLSPIFDQDVGHEGLTGVAYQDGVRTCRQYASSIDEIVLTFK
jgi:hypothetical protein